MLRDVVAARPPARCRGRRQVYDTHVLTEDNELTLRAAAPRLADPQAPKECLLETEIMTTWRDLWEQRLRWKRGALENLIDYGFTRSPRATGAASCCTHLGVLVTARRYLASLIVVAGRSPARSTSSPSGWR